MTNEERLAELEDQNYTMTAHILQLRAHIKACKELICVIGEQSGGDRNAIRDALKSRGAANLEAELLRIERQYPALAARVDLRKIEDLF